MGCTADIGQLSHVVSYGSPTGPVSPLVIIMKATEARSGMYHSLD